MILQAAGISFLAIFTVVVIFLLIKGFVELQMWLADRTNEFIGAVVPYFFLLWGAAFFILKNKS